MAKQTTASGTKPTRESSRQRDRMLVTVLDDDGHIRCERGEQTLFGALASSSIRPGESVRLAVTASGPEETSLEIVGRPYLDEESKVKPGLRFSIDIARVTRATTTQDSDPFTPNATQVLAAVSNSMSGNPEPSTPSSSAEEPHPSPAGSWPTQSAAMLGAFALLPSEPSGVFGSLSGMSLPEVLQSLELGRRYATVLVRPKGEATGVLRMEQGQIVFAAMGPLQGEDAFFALAPKTRGSFLIQFDEERPAGLEPNISSQMHWLLLEAARRTDESSLAKPPAPPAPPLSNDTFPAYHAPPFDLPPEASATAERSLADAEPEENDSGARAVASDDLTSALESAIVNRGPHSTDSDAFDHEDTSPAMFSRFFTEAETPKTPTDADRSSISHARMSAIDIDDEIERARSDEGDRSPSGWTGSYSAPSES